jgi:pimeloyl-ACP methyl ester carboxylesterase
MPAASDSGLADVNGIKLYYAVYGSGEPLLMLHGGLGHSDVWGAQIPAFAKKYKVIAVDSRGHGRSTRDDHPFGYDLMADDVVALMDNLGIDKASIVGWSDGGIIGLDIAIRHPERLDKLFAFGANYNLSGLKDDIDTNPTFNAYIERAGKDYERLSPTPKDYDDFVQAIAAMWYSEPDFSKEQMMGIKSPVAIADGEHDEAIRPEHTKEMAELIPGAKLVILPNVSHFAFWQDPQLFNKAVLDFLAGS